MKSILSLASCFFLLASYSFAQVKHDLIPYVKAGKYGFADKDRKVVIEPKYDGAYLFYDGLAAVKTGDKMGYIDSKGTMVIPAKYDACGNFANGFGQVQSNGKWSFVDKTGKELTPLKY